MPGAAHFVGKRGVAHSVQQRSKQGVVGPSVQCIRVRGKRRFGKKLLNCSVDLDLRLILHK